MIVCCFSCVTSLSIGMAYGDEFGGEEGGNDSCPEPLSYAYLLQRATLAGARYWLTKTYNEGGKLSQDVEN